MAEWLRQAFDPLRWGAKRWSADGMRLDVKKLRYENVPDIQVFNQRGRHLGDRDYLTRLIVGGAIRGLRFLAPPVGKRSPASCHRNRPACRRHRTACRQPSWTAIAAAQRCPARSMTRWTAGTMRQPLGRAGAATHLSRADLAGVPGLDGGCGSLAAHPGGASLVVTRPVGPKGPKGPKGLSCAPARPIMIDNWHDRQLAGNARPRLTESDR